MQVRMKTSRRSTHHVTRLASYVALGGSLVALGACEDKAPRVVTDAAPTSTSRPVTAAVDAGAPGVAPPSVQPTAAADAAEPRRFDPKHRCPTGTTHFYLEGDFCRRRCLSTADCGKRERCSAMEYPYVVDGGPAGTAHFCEGT